MKTAHFALLLTGCAALAPLPAWGTCTLGRLVELPVTMRGLQPLLPAGINGKELLFIADSGAAYSMLTPAAAAELKLRLELLPPWFGVTGVGGETQVWMTTVKTFKLLKWTTPDVKFLVAGNDLGNEVAGIIGQNLFHVHDVEYDLANGVIRIFKPEDCKNVNFAYWAKAAGQPVEEVDLEYAGVNDPHTAANASVNGTRIRVWFDSGAYVSMLALDAARRAGITPDSPGVTPAGQAGGIGRHTVRTWIAPVESFRIGDEEVKHTHLRIAESAIESAHVDMLLGADFFLSHRIYVANSEHKVFFTYNGGPVFNLTVMPAHGGAQAAPQPGDTTAAAAAPDAAPAAAASGVALAEPTDAAAYARRGSASAARRDYGPAIADLNRACELAPGESAYFYQRGLAHLGNREPQAALSDFDQAIKLKPDDVPALLERARLHADAHEPAAAVLADLDAADHAAPRESDQRIALGDLYQRAHNYPAAIDQYTKWIDAHQLGDVRMPQALTARCWAGVRWGQELDKTLANCDAGLSKNPVAARDGLGYVYLRRGDYDKAIADFDKALHINPGRVSALYGRGIAKLRAGKSGGQADIAAATGMDPKIAEQAAEIGISP